MPYVTREEFQEYLAWLRELTALPLQARQIAEDLDRDARAEGLPPPPDTEHLARLIDMVRRKQAESN